MELDAKISQLKARKQKQKQYIHSPAHLLADELSKGFADPKHFGAYLKLALTYNHDMLRKIAEEVKEQKSVRYPARLFMFLVKKARIVNSKE
jgi:hypothetical protein